MRHPDDRHARDPEEPALAGSPQQVVGSRVQTLMAARLGRAFLPLGLLLLAGVAAAFARGPGDPGALALALGAPAAAGAALMYGLRGVQRAFGRVPSPALRLAGPASLVPPVFGLYVVGWRGLRDLAVAGAGGLVPALAMTALGAWFLREWLRVLEVARLGEAMADLQVPGEPAW